MTITMMGASEHDYIKSYESAVSQLLVSPEDKSLQHQAVLALARAGSLDFAISEYERYGLSKINNHEDIMALGARLSKDLYLRSSDKAALEHARDSAHKYEAAFQTSSGYYSGINAATMALMADMPTDIIKGRASTIHQALPNPDEFSSETRYFIEATRAESHLLLGEAKKAKETLQKAVQHDPLNYAAHATTLKQFRMILDKLAGGHDGLVEFSPPKSVHFAGHIFGGDDMGSEISSTRLTEAEMTALSASITDAIQKEDIGFGFGSLAAGADILFAEALLKEGAELHLVLPTEVESFINYSVLPFGGSWKPRFDSCLKQATSLKILPSTTKWPHENQNRYAGQIAMGDAVLRSKSLYAKAGQLLILNSDAKLSYTATHARDWKNTGRTQTILPFPAYKKVSTPSKPLEKNSIFEFNLAGGDDQPPVSYKTADALTTAIKAHMHHGVSKGLSVHVSTSKNKDDPTLSALMQKAKTNQILISDVTASILTFANEPRFHITYAGHITLPNKKMIRAYNLYIAD